MLNIYFITLYIVNQFLFISGGEIFVILVIILLLFGSKKVPEVARGIAKGMKEFQKATDDIKNEINHNTSHITEESEDIKEHIDDYASGMKKNIDEMDENIKG